MIRHLVCLSTAVALAVPCMGQTTPASLADLPDPLVGTDSQFELSHGNTYPAVLIPFGMVAWTAQAGEGGWPFQYAKNTIQGLLATHRPSAWSSDNGPFSLMSLSGELSVLPKDRATRFSHANEDAKAYGYSVRLENGVRMEIAPSARGGAMRFTFRPDRRTGLCWTPAPGAAPSRFIRKPALSPAPVMKSWTDSREFRSTHRCAGGREEWTQISRDGGRWKCR